MCGYWINFATVGIAHTGFIFFVLVPGYLPVWPSILRLMSPSVDRAMRSSPFFLMVWAGYYRYHRFGFNLPMAYYFIATSVLVLTMVFRRAPKRITANPWFWLLAFVNTDFPTAICR